jgi:hypothetical protein
MVSSVRIGLLALLLCAPSIASAQLTETQKASARALMDEGHARRAKGDHKGALESFRAAHALVHAARSGVEVGRSLLDLGRLVEAREAFLEVVAMPAPPNEPSPSAAARAEARAIAADLDQRIPTLTVTVTGATSAHITVDGREAKTDTRLDPGEHLVKGTEGKEERTATVTLAERDHKTITLDFSVPPPPPVVAAPSRTVLWIGLAVTGAGVVVGSVTGALAFSTASSAKRGCEQSQCPPPHDDLFASRRYGTISNVAFVVAGAGAVVSVIGWFTSRPERASVSPTVGLGTIGVIGSF